MMTNTRLAWINRCYGNMIYQQDHAPFHYSHIWAWVIHQSKLHGEMLKKSR
jgi:hypothetical protein